MHSVRLKMYDLKSIRLLGFMQFIAMLVIIPCCFWERLLGVVYIFTGIFLLECIIQSYVIISSKGEVQFNTNGLEIQKKNLSKSVNWDAVQGIYYNSFKDIFPFLSHCTLELWIECEGKTILVDNEIGNIKCTKQKYKQIVSLIPYDVLKKNEFLLYRNIVEKSKQKERIFMQKNLLYKTSDKKYKEKYNKFLLLCEKYNAKIIKFDYYKKVFGNFVIEIEYNDTLQTIITDRGEIVFNGKSISNNSYLDTGQDTFSKLLELVEKEIFSK